MARTDAGDDDVELLRRASRGDQAAAAEFYRRQAQYVWSVVRRFALDDDEAMDASQEAFLRIFRGSTFSGKSSLRTWVFRVATSAAIDLLRSPRGQRHDTLDAAHDHPQSEAEADPALRARIATAIAQLPVAQREVFVLCEIMDVQHEEVAAMLGVPIGTSRRRLFDAKARLRTALAGVMQEWKR